MEDNEDLSRKITAPLWLVLLLAGSGFGWFARPAADPEYITKAELLERMSGALGPLVSDIHATEQVTRSNIYRIDQLERRVDSLERRLEKTGNR